MISSQNKFKFVDERTSKPMTGTATYPGSGKYMYLIMYLYRSVNSQFRKNINVILQHNAQ